MLLARVGTVLYSSYKKTAACIAVLGNRSQYFCLTAIFMSCLSQQHIASDYVLGLRSGCHAPAGCMQGGCPWKEHLFTLEEELGVTAPILYVLYEDERERKWRIQCVPPSAGSFDQRKGLPAAWRGLRDDVLSEACGIPGCVFVHASGFIGGNSTYEGVLEMARRSIAA